jgi:hypothetical protein
MLRRAARALTGVTALFFAVSCTESAGPETVKRQPGAPLFSHSSSGITLNQRNSAIGQSGTVLTKGFNPTNPHVGDAIIATFLWLGSTNIIDSVVDRLSNGTRVGNTFALVEYVTAGGVSMATYVAANVQNFPDPNQNTAEMLVVQAFLSELVVDGGLVISAFTGVHSDFPQARGASRSDSAAVTTQTPDTAHPGPITVNGGALAYGVTMSRPPVSVGLTPQQPEAFQRIDRTSDQHMAAAADFAVPDATRPVDPQWTWFYDDPTSGCAPSTPCTWLATVLTLNPAPVDPPPPAADDATILGADTKHNGFQTNVIPRRGQCRYRYEVTNPAPDAIATITWDGGSQVDDDFDGWIVLPTPKETRVFTLTVTAPGRSPIQSPPLTVYGLGTNLCVLLAGD